MRVAYIVLTCEKYEKTRMMWQMETVFRSVPKEDIYYLGHTMRPVDRLFSWGAADDYDSLPYKFVDFFVHWEEEVKGSNGGQGEPYDWFFLMDDDTYVYIDRLQKRVGQIPIADPHKELYMEGCYMTHLVGTPWGIYHSGGAGTLLSAKVYQEIRECLRRMVIGPGGEKTLYTAPHCCADICLGLWASGLNGLRKEHLDDYHPEMSTIAGRTIGGRMVSRRGIDLEGERGAITFHHLKTKEDFWGHWLLGQVLRE